MGQRTAFLVGCLLLSLLALQACHVAADRPNQGYEYADPAAAEGAAAKKSGNGDTSSAFPGGEAAGEGAGGEGEGEEVGGMRSGEDAEETAEGVTPSSTQGTPGDSQGKMAGTEGEGNEGASYEGGADAPEGEASAGMEDDSVGAALNSSDYGSKVNYTKSWEDIKHGEWKGETIIGAAIGVVVGMSVCFCFVGVCYIRQRNIARAQYGAPQGGAIEL